MSLLERIEAIATQAEELSQLATELREDIMEAVNDPSWVLPTEDNNKENDTNSTTEDTTREKGGKS